MTFESGLFDSIQGDTRVKKDGNHILEWYIYFY